MPAPPHSADPHSKDAGDFATAPVTDAGSDTTLPGSAVLPDTIRYFRHAGIAIAVSHTRQSEMDTVARHESTPRHDSRVRAALRADRNKLFRCKIRHDANHPA